MSIRRSRSDRRTRTARAVQGAPFPFTSTFRNGPRRQGFASPRSLRAPLTAPGRSEKPSPLRRERGQNEKDKQRLPLVGSEPNPAAAPNINRLGMLSQPKLALVWTQPAW
jgi:hypothetical protein